MKTAKTLLALSRTQSSSADILWLRLQILLSSGDVAGALKAARESGDRGGISRLWWRMEGVRAGIEMLEEGCVEWKGEKEKEREWVKALLREDRES